MLWEDGKGSGRKAGVDVRNFGQVTAVTITDEVHVGLNDNVAFSVDTGILTIPASFSGPVISLKNLEGSRDIIARGRILIDAPSAGSEFSVFRKPSEGVLAANLTKVPLNRNFESGKDAFTTVEIWDNATGLAGITGYTAVTDGTFGPAPLFENSLDLGFFILGQNDIVTVQLTSGIAGYEATVGLSFYFDTTGAK